MCKYLFRLVLLGFSLTLLSCGKGSPTSPGPPPPVDTTVRHPLTIPGTNPPLVMELWITFSTPPKDSQVAVGTTAKVSYTCRGPAGWSAYLTADFLSGDKVVEGVTDMCLPSAGGNTRMGANRCDAEFGRTLQITTETPEITDIQWKVWAEKGTATEFPGCPIATPKEHLGWKPMR